MLQSAGKESSETRMQGDKLVRKAGSVIKARLDKLGDVMERCTLKMLEA